MGQSGSSALPGFGRAVLLRPPVFNYPASESRARARNTAKPPRSTPNPLARIFTHVLPLLRVALAIAQSMMKSTGLKGPGGWVRFGQAVLPESNPAFDCEFQIVRRAE